MKNIVKWIVIFVILMIFTIIYARYVGTIGLITKEYSIYDDNLPQTFDGLKIVHFSDLHFNRALDTNKVESVVNEINLINPDIVVFTGDLIDMDMDISEKEYNKLTNILSKINAKYGKYAVMGNHDYKKYKEKVITVYNDSGFKYLDNSYDIIYGKNNEKIFIGGMNTVYYDMDDLDKTMEYFDNHDDIDYKIVLVHEPDIADKIVSDYSVNLILAGHSHNGQVRFPLVGPIYTPLHAKKYFDNYYKINDTSLYISSGIGVSTVNYRLWNRPSINFYRINKEKNKSS